MNKVLYSLNKMAAALNDLKMLGIAANQNKGQDPFYVPVQYRYGQ